MGGEGAPSCAEKKKKTLQSRMGGGRGSQGNAALPLLPLGPADRGFGDSPLSGPCARCTRRGSAGPRPGRCSPGQTCWSEPTQPLPTPTPTIINTGLDACSRCGAEDKVSSQVTEVKRVPALALP